MIACENLKNPETHIDTVVSIVEALLAANASVDMAKDDGMTPFLFASQSGCAEAISALLQANATVVNQGFHSPEGMGITPLIHASLRGHVEVATRLLEANAMVDLAMVDGATPMFIACKYGHLGVVQLLSSYGASRAWPFVAPHDTAEHIAALHGQHHVVAWLATN